LPRTISIYNLVPKSKVYIAMMQFIGKIKWVGLPTKGFSEIG
jgi:hypothetical protein